MTQITHKGMQVNTYGELPGVGSKTPQFKLVRSDLSELELSSLAGKQVVLNIFVSLDTSTCAASVRRFNLEAASRQNTVVLCISSDLPFAHNRFCASEGLEDVITLSTFRNPEFGRDYGVLLLDGKLKGLLSRAVVVLDENGIFKYTEQVPEISHEPDYESALKVLD